MYVRLFGCLLRRILKPSSEMDLKSDINQSPPNILDGEKTEPQQTPDVNDVTLIQSGSNGSDSRCTPKSIQTNKISLQEKSTKNEVTPKILPGRKLTKVRTLPNIAKCLLFTTSANNLLLSPRPSTEPALPYVPSAEDAKEKFCTISPPLKTDNIAPQPVDLSTCEDHPHKDVEQTVPVSVQENPTSVDQCLPSIPVVVSDYSHISSDSGSNIFKSDSTAGTFYSRDVPGENQIILLQNTTDSGKKKNSITGKRMKALRKKTKKIKPRDSSKDSLSVDEVTGMKTVALRKSKKRLSFKIPIADEGTPKDLSSTHDKRETKISRKKILKNKSTRERSPKQTLSPKEIPQKVVLSPKSSSPTYRSSKKNLTDKQSSNHLSRKTTVMNVSSNDVSSRDQSVEKRTLKASASKNKSITSRGCSGTSKALSNRSIKDNQLRIAKSQPQTNVTSKTQKNSLTCGSTSKKSTSNKNEKDNDIHKGSASSVSSTERVVKKRTRSGKRQHSKQRSLKQSSKGTRKDETSNVPPTEDTCCKGSLLIRNKINSYKAIENGNKVSEISNENRTLRETSRDRISKERKELSRAASQPIKQFDSSSHSSRSAVPKAVSETNHFRSETLKSTRDHKGSDGNQVRTQKSAPNRPIKEDKLQMQNAVNNSTIERVTLKQSFRELDILSTRQNLSIRSSHGDTSEGSRIPGRQEPKSDRVSDRLIATPTSDRSCLFRSRKNKSPLKLPYKDKGKIKDSLLSEPASTIKGRSGMTSKEIPVAGNFSTVVPPKNACNVKPSSKVPSRSTTHSSVEVTVKSKVAANTETKIKEIHSADSSEDMANKCLLSACRPSADVKVKSRSIIPTELSMKEINRKHSSKENLPKVDSNGEKLRKIFSIVDKDVKGDVVNEKSEDESSKKHDSIDRSAKHKLKSTAVTEKKQKTTTSGKPDGRKSTTEQAPNNKVRKKKLRKQKRLRSRFTKQHRIATCCGGRTQNVSAKHHKRPPTRPSIGSNKSKASETPSVKVNKEILTIHRSKKVRPTSRVKEPSAEKTLSSEVSSDESDSDYDSSDSSETNVAIIRDRRVVHPYIPWRKDKHMVRVTNQMNPGPILYRKSSIRLVPVEGYNFGVMYPLDSNAPAPARRSIGSSIAKESRRTRTVSQLEEKPVLFYETVGENFYQCSRSQSIVGHDLIAPQAPPRRVPLLLRERCLVHDRPSGPSKYNVRVRSPLPCICRHPQRVLMREVPERFDASAVSRSENYAIGYQFKDMPSDAPRRRSQDYVKEFLYDLGKSILPPDRYRGKLLTHDISTSYNFRSRMSNTNQGSAKSVPNKNMR